MKRSTLIFLLALLTAANMWAQEFTVGNLKFWITDESARTVEVAGHTSELSGKLTIPSTISFNQKIYKVTGIGICAFSKCQGITEVSLSSNLTRIGM